MHNINTLLAQSVLGPGGRPDNLDLYFFYTGLLQQARANILYDELGCWTAHCSKGELHMRNPLLFLEIDDQAHVYYADGNFRVHHIPQSVPERRAGGIGGMWCLH